MNYVTFLQHTMVCLEFDANQNALTQTLCSSENYINKG